ncbi:MAG: ATP-binding protein, partial [Candidatus Omnitrophota bacterium]
MKPGAIFAVCVPSANKNDLFPVLTKLSPSQDSTPVNLFIYTKEGAGIQNPGPALAVRPETFYGKTEAGEVIPIAIEPLAFKHKDLFNWWEGEYFEKLHAAISQIPQTYCFVAISRRPRGIMDEQDWLEGYCIIQLREDGIISDFVPQDSGKFSPLSLLVAPWNRMTSGMEQSGKEITGIGTMLVAYTLLKFKHDDYSLRPAIFRSSDRARNFWSHLGAEKYSGNGHDPQGSTPSFTEDDKLMILSPLQSAQLLWQFYFSQLKLILETEGLNLQNLAGLEIVGHEESAFINFSESESIYLPGKPADQHAIGELNAVLRRFIFADSLAQDLRVRLSRPANGSLRIRIYKWLEANPCWQAGVWLEDAELYITLAEPFAEEDTNLPYLLWQLLRDNINNEEVAGLVKIPSVNIERLESLVNSHELSCVEAVVINRYPGFIPLLFGAGRSIFYSFVPRKDYDVKWGPIIADDWRILSEVAARLGGLRPVIGRVNKTNGDVLGIIYKPEDAAKLLLTAWDDLGGAAQGKLALSGLDKTALEKLSQGNTDPGLSRSMDRFMEKSIIEENMFFIGILLGLSPENSRFYHENPMAALMGRVFSDNDVIVVAAQTKSAVASAKAWFDQQCIAIKMGRAILSALFPKFVLPLNPGIILSCLLDLAESIIKSDDPKEKKRIAGAFLAVLPVINDELKEKIAQAIKEDIDSGSKSITVYEKAIRVISQELETEELLIENPVTTLIIIIAFVGSRDVAASHKKAIEGLELLKRRINRPILGEILEFSRNITLAQAVSLYCASTSTYAQGRHLGKAPLDLFADLDNWIDLYGNIVAGLSAAAQMLNGALKEEQRMLPIRALEAKGLFAVALYNLLLKVYSGEWAINQVMEAYKSEELSRREKEISPYSLVVPEEEIAKAEREYGKDKILADLEVSGTGLQDSGQFGDQYNILNEGLEKLRQLLGRAPPTFRLVITTNFKLTEGNVAACNISNRIVYIHPYFFSLNKLEQIKILYHELISHIERGLSDEEEAMRDTDKAIGDYVEFIRSLGILLHDMSNIFITVDVIITNVKINIRSSIADIAGKDNMAARIAELEQDAEKIKYLETELLQNIKEKKRTFYAFMNIFDDPALVITFYEDLMLSIRGIGTLADQARGELLKFTNVYGKTDDTVKAGLVLDKVKDCVEQAELLSRQEEEEFIDLTEFLRDTTQAVNYANVNIVKALSFEHPVVRAVSSKLYGALLNLFSNAVDAMPQGGGITVSLELELIGGKISAVIKVSDTGTGISPGIMKRIFELRFTTKHLDSPGIIGGSGVGLWSVKNIIESFNGSVGVESQVGKGTTFTIVLPVQFLAREEISVAHKAAIGLRERVELVAEFLAGIYKKESTEVRSLLNKYPPCDKIFYDEILPAIKVIYEEHLNSLSEAGKPIILLITGEGGIGKTTIARGFRQAINKAFGKDIAVPFLFDDYILQKNESGVIDPATDRPLDPDTGKPTEDPLEKFQVTRFIRDLHTLQNGETIYKPVFDFSRRGRLQFFLDSQGKLKIIDGKLTIDVNIDTSTSTSVPYFVLEGRQCSEIELDNIPMSIRNNDQGSVIINTRGSDTIISPDGQGNLVLTTQSNTRILAKGSKLEILEAISPNG